jgi:hypothetical protein
LPTPSLFFIHLDELVQAAEVLSFESAFHRRATREHSPVSVGMGINVIQVDDLRHQIARLVEPISRMRFIASTPCGRDY